MAEALAEPAAPAPASQEPVEATSAAAPAAPAPAASDTPASEAPAAPGSEPAKPLGEKGVDELITQRRKRQEAERDAIYWRGVAQGAQQQAPQVQQPAKPQGPPTSDQFESWDDYLVSKARYEAREEIRNEIQQEKTRSQINTVESTWSEKLRKESEKDPDFQDTVAHVGNQVSGIMAAIIKGSENGPDLVRHLANNPQELSRIASLDPFTATLEMGKLTAKLAPSERTPVNKISQAPEPIKGLAATGSVGDTDLEKVSMDDFMSKRNAAQFKRR